MSWKVEVQADSTGTWASNSIRLETREEATRYGYDLAARWISVRDWKITETDDPVTHVCESNTVLKEVIQDQPVS